MPSRPRALEFLDDEGEEDEELSRAVQERLAPSQTPASKPDPPRLEDLERIVTIGELAGFLRPKRVWGAGPATWSKASNWEVVYVDGHCGIR